MKICTKCQELKPKTEFHKKKSGEDLLVSVCKMCKSKLDKAYRDANKEKIHAYNVRKYHADPEKVKARNKNYRDTLTPEKRAAIKVRKAEYNKNAPKEVKERKKEYDKQYFASEAGKLVITKSVHKRRAQKLSSDDGTVTSQALEELKITQNQLCAYCGTLLDFTAKGKVHLDHVIPLSKGGAHSITNVVWSCAHCNLLKSDKIINA